MVQTFKIFFIALLVFVISTHISAADCSSSSTSSSSQEKIANTSRLSSLQNLITLGELCDNQQQTVASLTNRLTIIEAALSDTKKEFSDTKKEFSDTKKELATLKALIENLSKPSTNVTSPHRNNITVTNNSMMGNASLFWGNIYSGNTYTGNSNYDWLEPVAYIGCLGFAVYVAWRCAYDR